MDEIAFVRKAQSSKEIIDATAEPCFRSDVDIQKMSHDFIRVWRHGLIDRIRIRGMLCTGK